jgi:chromatin remodeling complex protein RSC6
MSRTPDGFTLPQRLSPQLCQFLGLPNGSSMSRVDVTRQIINYARENSLMDGRVIHPDTALRSLLSITDTEQLNVFNFHRYFRHNFLGPDSVAALEMQVASMTTNDEEEEEEEDEEESSEEQPNDDDKNRNARRAPSGFVRPLPISNELCHFLGLPNGSLVPRVDATRSLNKYIRDNHLRDRNDGRVIQPDATLRELLRVPEGDRLTYFNLQRYLSPHFLRQNV